MYNTGNESVGSSQTSVLTKKSCLKRTESSTFCDSGSESSSISKPTMKREVSFTAVEITEYPMVLGDNPDCDGIPIQIGWKAQHSETVPLDTYEEAKKEPRKKSDLLLSEDKRRKIVEDFSRKEIDTAVREANQIKRYRKFSVDSMSSDEWDYKMERFERKVKKVMTLKFLKSPKKNKTLIAHRHSMPSVPSTVVATR
ncbi:unnamed protein product [Cylindrotheca closterium]|uniref:Uncharacterized protein n=1 Tax=Cylindrotheca closterium TaxID=2856 RepID=A0AAD2FXQ6_9STRA|nr:unnamed protein product [Cylindrotheca closterium]